jgi:hypothetical protein
MAVSASLASSSYYELPADVFGEPTGIVPVGREGSGGGPPKRHRQRALTARALSAATAAGTLFTATTAAGLPSAATGTLPPTGSCSPPLGCRALTRRRRAGCLGARARGGASLPATLTRGALGALLSSSGPALLAAAFLLIHGSPCAPCRFLPRNTALLIPFLDMLGLPLLPSGVR